MSNSPHKGDHANEIADARAKLAAEAGDLVPQATFRADGAFAFFRGRRGGPINVLLVMGTSFKLLCSSRGFTVLS